MSLIKDVGFFAYKDPYGWMDSMKGPRWENAIQKQKNIFQSYISHHVKKSDVDAVEKEMKDEQDYVDPLNIYGFSIEMKGGNRFAFRYLDLPGETICADLDVLEGGHIWYVQDNSHGAEEYKLTYQQGEQKKWSYKNKVGPYVAFVASKIYCLEEEKDLWYNKLVCVDAMTGTNRKVLLELSDPEWNLELIKGSHMCLFIRGNNAGQQRLWYITRAGHVEELTNHSTSFVPIGYRNDLSKEPCYFGLQNGRYHPFGFPKSYKFPLGKQQIPQTVFFETNDLITRNYGKRYVWNTLSGKLLMNVLGDIEPNPVLYWKLGSAGHTTISRFEFDRCFLFDNSNLPSFGNVKYIITHSKDGTKVPCVVVRHISGEPTKLLCIGYGAYGIPTQTDSKRWKSYLRRGWSLCVAMVRGGGDHDEAWAEAARAAKKLRSVEDFEACIEAAQKETKISASNTVIYGRSAGGYLVGACLARNPTGRLFKGVYTEVPYVDVLSTTVNPDLPLTKLEYHEFGNPRQNLVDAQALLRLSPIHSLPEQRAPSIFVLDRIGLKDKEVFAYESVKWITTLQENTKTPKILAITDDEGHFASESKKMRERAEDLCILESWFGKNNQTQ